MDNKNHQQKSEISTSQHSQQEKRTFTVFNIFFFSSSPIDQYGQNFIQSQICN